MRGRALASAPRASRPSTAGHGRPAARLDAARARSCIRGTSWTADSTTNAIRWLTPRATRPSSRSSASVVNSSTIDAPKTTASRTPETSPNVRPSRVTARGPSDAEHVLTAREQEAVEDHDRHEQERGDPKRTEQPSSQPGRRRRNATTAIPRTPRVDGRQEERGDQHEQETQQFRDRMPVVEPAGPRDVIARRRARHGSMVWSPRLNSVRTEIGSAVRITNTIVKLIVLSSGSLVRPWAKTDWKTPSPSVRKRATRSPCRRRSRRRRPRPRSERRCTRPRSRS